MHQTLLDILFDEIKGARILDRPLLHIRITSDAVPGSPIAVPLTPERARTVRLMAFEGGVVESGPEIYLRALELVVHPVDWMRILLEIPNQYLSIGSDQYPDTLMGVKVEYPNHS